MTTQILWRDACAMSKSLRKHLGARAHNTPLSVEESLDLVQRLQPQRWQPQDPAPAAPAPAPPRRGNTATVIAQPLKHRSPPGGLFLGRTPKKGWLSKPQELWLTEEGLLRQTVLYGCTGAGRTETLLTLALNAADPRKRHGHSPAPKPRSVLYMDGKGDVSIYTKTLSGLSERQSAGALRVINLMTGPEATEQREQGLKVSHSLDLFDGFDEAMLGQWLVSMVPEALLTEPDDARLVREMMPTVARLAVAFAQQEKRRITLRVLAELMTEAGAQDHAQNLAGAHGHLARQWAHQNWGDPASRRAGLLKAYHEQLTVPFQFLGHVFEADHPEVSLDRLHEIKDAPAYVLVLAPAMGRSHETLGMLTRAIATSFRLCLEKRAPMTGCDTLAVVDEFNYCLEPADIKALVRLQDRGCGVIWAADAPNDAQPAWRRGDVDLFEWAGVAKGTHVMMHQCTDHRHGGGHFEAAYVRCQQRHWPAGGFSDQPLEEVFQALAPGHAVIWDASTVWRAEMDYANVPHLKVAYLSHVKYLPASTYAFSSAGLAQVDLERQARVLRERLGAWGGREGVDAPALSWCQETVARMLGFSNWHEANEVLGKH